ncbi:MAG TPA: hypothetical protein VE780_12090 [Thermoleophilaceae bacterium]|nr:hypothetical protein [Thermoleophilaceae bacterium]
MVPEREEAPAGGSICGPLIAASIGVRLPLGFTNLRMLPMNQPRAPGTCSFLGLAAVAPEV